MAQVLRESTLAVGEGGSGQVPLARSKQHMERKMNMQRLAESCGDITAIYCAMDIMSDKIQDFFDVFGE